MTLTPTEDGPTAAVKLRPVTQDDLEFLVSVYASSRADELALVPWTPEQKDAFVRMQFEAQHREYMAHFPAAEYDVILLDGRPAGRVWIGRDDTEIHLLDIAILPEYQNRGIGGTILRALMAEAERERKPLRHMVFQLNTGALRFYERLGFRHFEDVGAYLHMEYTPAGVSPSERRG